MKNQDQWTPSLYEVDARGRLAVHIGGENGVYPGSILVSRLTAEAVATAIKVHARGRILDLGCGRCPFFGLYRPLTDDVVCVDWEKSQHPVEHADLYCDLSQRLPLEDASFDTVLHTQVLEHIPTPESLVQEISRVLKPDGKLILSVPFMYWIHEAPYDYYRYTEYALQRFCAVADFELLELTALGGPLDVLCDVAGKSAARLPLIGRWISRSIQAPAWWIHRVRKNKDTKRSAMPLVYLLTAKKRRRANGERRSA